MGIDDLCHALPLVADNLLDDFVINMGDRQHGYAGVAGAVGRVVLEWETVGKCSSLHRSYTSSKVTFEAFTS